MSNSVRFPVEAGHILLFARAIGDFSGAYQGAMQDTGEETPAPPTFVQSSAEFTPSYPLRPRDGEEWFGSGADSGFMPDGGGGLHAEQHFEYYKPVVAGMVLSIEVRPGEQWAKAGRRGGTLKFTEVITEYRDKAGDLVVLARSVGVKTERVVERAHDE
jgi:uncharacterized protein YgiB involved in biofilm formation